MARVRRILARSLHQQGNKQGRSRSWRRPKRFAHNKLDPAGGGIAGGCCELLSNGRIIYESDPISMASQSFPTGLSARRFPSRRRESLLQSTATILLFVSLVKSGIIVEILKLLVSWACAPMSSLSGPGRNDMREASTGLAATETSPGTTMDSLAAIADRDSSVSTAVELIVPPTIGNRVMEVVIPFKLHGFDRRIEFRLTHRPVKRPRETHGFRDIGPRMLDLELCGVRVDPKQGHCKKKTRGIVRFHDPT